MATTAWGMKITQTNGPTVHLTVMSAADAIVGEYSIYVETKTKQGNYNAELSYRMKHSETLNILFNAWCKGLNTCMLTRGLLLTKH